jgi:hypothetical protein
MAGEICRSAAAIKRKTDTKGRLTSGPFARTVKFIVSQLMFYKNTIDLIPEQKYFTPI